MSRHGPGTLLCQIALSAAVGGAITYLLTRRDGGGSPRAALSRESGEHPDCYVRTAGRREMRDPPRRWTLEDEQSDESFPASDPPGNY
ncbi:hypothetical protein KTN05_02030 [Paracoccus sp. Z118]|uniref:hypothetical protein n=1 Tax=Paracoccus sp. Z118 TaxID=2851017 RepID=UPI001C2C574F|nr:hypothetical protein [Paracoccus sp. Z118]MBV0890627.1 hypothetical protein [Paracoccus sp. Z118]